MPDKLHMSKDEIQRRYDNTASDHYRVAWFNNAIFRLGKRRRELLAKRSGKILDVACGTGENFPYFSPTDDITAIDYSEGMLTYARDAAAKYHLNVNFYQMDAENLLFPDDSFDTVISALSTCTFPDPVKALQEMARVCRSEGRILLLEHGLSSLGIAARYQERNAHNHFQHVGCRWNQEPLDLVKQAGLQVIEHSRHVLGVFHTIKAKP